MFEPLLRADPPSGTVLDPMVVRGVPSASPADPRIARAAPDAVRFVALLAQLGLLLLAFRVYHLETPAFLILAVTAFAGFCIHYWLPFRLKEGFAIMLSMGGAYLLLDPLTATLILAAGFVFFAIAASAMAYRWKLGLVITLGVALLWARSQASEYIPSQFWPVFGAIFMFRMMIYMYDLRYMRSRPSLREYLSYFYLLPNYYFLLFPVVDFQTLRRTYYQRDIHLIVQQGIGWMARGTVQLTLYRLIYHLKPPLSPDAVTSFAGLVTATVATYALYLRVSGQFHIIVGMLHLFGYDLPETHRRYFLASSLTDFWRRINIYWKDFMVKLVYFPVYFRLRRSGETRAQIVATALVFTTTWLLHSYQWFWLRGEFLLTWPDTLFWAILGVLVTVNLLWEARRPARRADAGSQSWPLRALKVAVTFSVITTLWSLWNSPSVGAWLELVSWWEVG